MILFFFGALGAFNGIILSIYFWKFARPYHISNRFFSAFLFCLSFRALKSAFFHFSMDKFDLPITFLVPSIAAFFFIGPLLTIYLQSAIGIKYNAVLNWKRHLVFLSILMVILLVLFSFPEKRNFVVDVVYMVWFVYSIFSISITYPLIKKTLTSNTRISSFEIWILSLISANLVILFFFVIGHFTTYIVGSISFSFLSYLLLGFIFFSKKRKLKKFEFHWLNQRTSLNAKDVNKLILKLKKVMISNEMYRNPKLKSTDVAEELGISVNQLSELINVHLSKNFSTFLNEYRVNHAKQIISSSSPYTLEAIGYESGFNSRSTFYKAFKKVTGTSPSKYHES